MLKQEYEVDDLVREVTNPTLVQTLTVRIDMLYSINTYSANRHVILYKHLQCE